MASGEWRVARDERREVGRIKRSADPAPHNDSTARKDLCRIGVAALLDFGLPARMPGFPATEFANTLG